MRRHLLHVLIPGTNTTLVTPDGDVIMSPAVVSVDHAGRPRSFGTQAITSAIGMDLDPVTPYTASRVDLPDLAAAHLDWLIRVAGGRRATAAVVIPSTPPWAQERWAAVSSLMATPALAVSRTVAAVAGLGLEAGSARMVIDQRDDGVEVAVVGEDGVIHAEHHDRSSVAVVAGAARSLLTRIDPDLEWAIREDAVHLMVERFDSRWTEALAMEMRVAVELIDDPVALLNAGVHADRPAIERYLTSVDAGKVRRRPALHPRYRRLTISPR